MDAIFPALFWPSTVLLDITASPLCSVGCVRSIWKEQIRKSLGAMEFGSSSHAGGQEVSLCFGNYMDVRSCCVLWEAPFQGSLCLCALKPVSLLSVREKSPTQHRPRLVFTRNMVCLAVGRGLPAAEITFQEVPGEILSSSLENVGSMQILEHRKENNPGYRALEMKRYEP